MKRNEILSGANTVGHFSVVHLLFVGDDLKREELRERGTRCIGQLMSVLNPPVITLK